MSVTVNIVFRGLIALAPIYELGETETNRVSAYLVEARQIPSHATEPDDDWRSKAVQYCVAIHEPKIKFHSEVADCNNAEGVCKYQNNACICDVERREISLLSEIEAQRKTLSRDREKPRPLPLTAEDGTDFDYLLNLSHLNFSLNPSLKDDNPPKSLVGRFSFYFEELLACDFSFRRDELQDYVHPLELRRIGADHADPDKELTQAGAQTLVATTSVEGDVDDPPILRLGSLDDDTSYDFRLDPTRDIRVEVTNMRVGRELEFGHPCVDGIARDFAFFYELMSEPPPWHDRPLPHSKFLVSKSLLDVKDNRCESFKAMMSRPICPMGTVNP